MSFSTRLAVVVQQPQPNSSAVISLCPIAVDAISMAVFSDSLAEMSHRNVAIQIAGMATLRPNAVNCMRRFAALLRS